MIKVLLALVFLLIVMLIFPSKLSSSGISVIDWAKSYFVGDEGEKDKNGYLENFEREITKEEIMDLFSTNLDKVAANDKFYIYEGHIQEKNVDKKIFLAIERKNIIIPNYHTINKIEDEPKIYRFDCDPLKEFDEKCLKPLYEGGSLSMFTNYNVIGNEVIPYNSVAESFCSAKKIEVLFEIEFWGFDNLKDIDCGNNLNSFIENLKTACEGMQFRRDQDCAKIDKVFPKIDLG